MGIDMLPFLTEDTRQPMLEDYMQHMSDALKVCGEDHVGIGTDVPFFTVEDADLKEMLKNEKQRKAAGVGSRLTPPRLASRHGRRPRSAAGRRI